jgi:hypothetical protein
LDAEIVDLEYSIPRSISIRKFTRAWWFEPANFRGTVDLHIETGIDGLFENGRVFTVRPGSADGETADR